MHLQRVMAAVVALTATVRTLAADEDQRRAFELVGQIGNKTSERFEAQYTFAVRNFLNNNPEIVKGSKETNRGVFDVTVWVNSACGISLASCVFHESGNVAILRGSGRDISQAHYAIFERFHLKELRSLNEGEAEQSAAAKP